jgi:hypothetical protein
VTPITAPISVRRNGPGPTAMASTGREYRARHPDYTDHNRLEQRQRDRCRRVARLAKMDASTLYITDFIEKVWSGRRDSNPRPQPWQWRPSKTWG